MNIEETRSLLVNYFSEHKISHGIGNKERACTVASFNIALSGKVNDERPDCMSPVIHNWIIPIQDAIPEYILNDGRWAKIAPFAAGTNDGRDAERFDIIADWVWSTVLPTAQGIADKGGFGKEWCNLLNKKSHRIAAIAADVADYAYLVTLSAEEDNDGRKADVMDYADITLNASKAYGKGIADFWEKVNPWSVFEKLVNLPDKI